MHSNAHAKQPETVKHCWKIMLFSNTGDFRRVFIGKKGVFLLNQEERAPER